ncbi:hypothetical protein LINPERPRIM_LOCUS17624 [Linum perenne]
MICLPCHVNIMASSIFKQKKKKPWIYKWKSSCSEVQRGQDKPPMYI